MCATRQKISGLKGFPQFQKDNRSAEYKTTGWKLANDRKSITFTDKKGIGRLKIKGTHNLNFYQPDQIKRVRLVKRADGYCVQFCIQVDREEVIEPTAVNPAYTSQKCSSCGVVVKKSLSTRTHVCQCGCTLDLDHNAARNILELGLRTAGHVGTSSLVLENVSGQTDLCLGDENRFSKPTGRKRNSK